MVGKLIGPPVAALVSLVSGFVVVAVVVYFGNGGAAGGGAAAVRDMTNQAVGKRPAEWWGLRAVGAAPSM
jgi:hypothetical protein